MRFYYLTLLIIIFNLALQVPAWFGFTDYQNNGDKVLINETVAKYESMKENSSFFSVLLETAKILWEVAKLSLLAPYALYNNLVLFFPSKIVLIFVIPLSIIFYIGLFQLVTNKYVEV